jgi:chemotaxis protein methyltransferase CheR
MARESSTPGPKDVELEALKAKILRDYGLDCGQYKENYLKRRLAVRMRALGLKSYFEYMKHLDQDKGEWDKLKDRITINVTEFFRDPETFQFLEKEIVPGLLEKDQLEVWSAGCASGEEPFSLALLFCEALGARFHQFSLNILATDIDPACLSRVREATYENRAIAQLKPEWQTAYFRRQGEKVVVADKLRRIVSVRALDLISDPSPGLFHLIFCRNVMIYFSKELHQRLFELFCKSLYPGGFLVIGKTETMLGKAREYFTCVSARERVYQRL